MQLYEELISLQATVSLVGITDEVKEYQRKVIK